MDKNGDPNMFEFTIESCGIMKPYKILIESLNSLSQRLKNVNTELEKTFSNTNSSIKIKDSPGVMKAFDIVIDNENHTIGNLLQSHINKYFKEQGGFVGYMNPHPLKNEIFLRIKSDNINQIKEMFNTTISQLIETLNQLKGSVLKEFEGKITIKKKNNNNNN